MRISKFLSVIMLTTSVFTLNYSTTNTNITKRLTTNHRNTEIDIFSKAVNISPISKDFSSYSDIAHKTSYNLETNVSTGKITAVASGSRDDIQAAVDMANTGDIIELPQGNFDFDGTVIVKKGIHIRGKGKNKTILRKVGNGNDKEYMFRFQIYDDSQAAISGIKLIDTYGPYSEHDYNNETVGVEMAYGCKDFRIFDCEFEGFSYAGVVTREYNGSDPQITWWKTQGVIYDCRFINCYMPEVGYGVVVYGANQKSWDEPSALGTDWFIFVEDNYFSGCRHHVASGEGGRYVCRFNIMEQNRNSHAIDAHGKPYGDYLDDGRRGTRAYEIYNNTIQNPWHVFYEDTAIGLRGGTGVVFNNTIRDMYVGIELSADGCIVYGPCSYPVPNQISQLYIWNNTFENMQRDDLYLFMHESFQQLIQEGRDYFLYEMPYYAPYPYPHPLRNNENDEITIQSSASPTSGQVPLTINFTAEASGGTSPYSYTWDFGDGGSSFEQNPSYTFYQEGEYTVVLTVTDNNSNQASDSLTITASANSAYNLTISSATGSPAPGSGGTTSPSPGSHSYTMGSSVPARAIPNTNYRFAKWSGDVSNTQAYNNEISITMDNDKSLSAYFFTRCGDVNGDLSISPADAQTAFDIFLGRITNPTEAEKENADANCDGTASAPNITPADAHAIFMKYIGKNELPCDCSCKSRSSSLSYQSKQAEGIYLTINDITAAPSDEIIVPIIVNKPSLIDAFGFDFLYPAHVLEFIGVEKTEFNKESYYVDASKISEGVVRAGGYRNTPIINNPSPILIKLVFKATGEVNQPSSFKIINPVDDVKNAFLRIVRSRERTEKSEPVKK